MKAIAELHHITQDLEGVSHAQQAKLACEGGARWIQFRSKIGTTAERKAKAIEVLAVCNENNSALIINDDPLLAKTIGAHGVHLGQSDMSPQKAREILGPNAIIGGTANTFEEVDQMTEAGVDYVGVGPFRHTQTKATLSPVLGIEGYRNICAACVLHFNQIPIIGIGGITHADVGPLLATLIDGIAVSSAINKADDPAKSTQLFLEELDKQLT
jgi:thiamine-phosphate pyrophosphorylase